MGTTIVVAARDGDVPDEVFDWFHHVDEAFSTFKPTSAISRIRRGELALEDASDEVQRVLERCRELRETTDGYFDAEIGRLDPSGF
ncbi:MAG: FAD:protein FMN transferase, partial [Actinobacteria bacterium]|nr:FAD:protein FMN transferase [Actinomycetota bacterium]